MEPRLLAEDARYLPTSSWWALETSLTLARCGSCRRPSGGHGGGCGVIGGEIVPQPPSRVFFYTARPEGHHISEMRHELEEEVRLPKGKRRGCLEGSLAAVAVRVGQDRVRWPPRYPWYRPGPTGGHRRGRGWHEVTRTREILGPVQDKAAE